jgi:hypothetical protein
MEDSPAGSNASGAKYGDQDVAFFDGLSGLRSKLKTVRMFRALQRLNLRSLGEGLNCHIHKLYGRIPSHHFECADSACIDDARALRQGSQLVLLICREGRRPKEEPRRHNGREGNELSGTSETGSDRSALILSPIAASCSLYLRG